MITEKSEYALISAVRELAYAVKCTHDVLTQIRNILAGQGTGKGV